MPFISYFFEIRASWQEVLGKLNAAQPSTAISWASDALIINNMKHHVIKKNNINKNDNNNNNQNQ